MAAPLAVALIHLTNAAAGLESNPTKQREDGDHQHFPSLPPYARLDSRLPDLDSLAAKLFPPQQRRQPTPPSYQNHSARQCIPHGLEVIPRTTRFERMEDGTDGLGMIYVGDVEEGEEGGVLILDPGELGEREWWVRVRGVSEDGQEGEDGRWVRDEGGLRGREV